MALRLTLSITAALALLAGSPVFAAARCDIKGLAQMPVTLRGAQPLIAAKINGKDVFFQIDSGAVYSIISSASAAALNLPQTIAPAEVMIGGVGGDKQPMIANVREFGLGGGTVSNMEFLVVGSWMGHGDVVGMLGQNVFSFADTEFDVAGGFVRMFGMQGCKDAEKAYWLKAGESYSAIPIQPINKFESQIKGTAYLNGKKIRVIFDTGAATSTISLRAAERAGIRTSSPGVRQTGSMMGIGTQQIPVFSATFASFKVGDEEIRDTRMNFADIDLREADMLVGIDFFLSHRVLISFSSNKMIFSRSGAAAGSAREPANKEEYSRRAAVHAARNDFPGAIADLTKAIELSPDDAELFFQRGRMYQGNRQSARALEDLDQAIALQSGHLDARLMRAGLRLRRLEQTGQGSLEDVRGDLESARSVVAKESDLHFEIGRLYAGIDVPRQSLVQFNQWLVLHGDDSRAPDARAFTCRARALIGEDLPQALSDCNAAVRDRMGMAFPLESRGLVYLRMRNWDRAITDLSKVLSAEPDNAWALYARGLARIGKGATAEGDRDIAAARAVSARTVATAVAHGFVVTRP